MILSKLVVGEMNPCSQILFLLVTVMESRVDITELYGVIVWGLEGGREGSSKCNLLIISG